VSQGVPCDNHPSALPPEATPLGVARAITSTRHPLGRWLFRKDLGHAAIVKTPDAHDEAVAALPHVGWLFGTTAGAG
jgi:hypothetical protein